MKYIVNIFESYSIQIMSITTTSDDENFISFPAEIGNPNYDQFLELTGLTDAEVHELEPNVWYDFPEEQA